MDLVVNLLGNQDAARFSHGLKSGSEVYALSQQITVFDHNVAQMNADPKAQLSFWSALAAGKLRLDLKRALDSFDNRGKFCDQTFARRVGDSSLVPFDELRKDASGCS